MPRELPEQIVEAISCATELVVTQDPAVIRAALPEMIAVYDNLLKYQQGIRREL